MSLFNILPLGAAKLLNPGISLNANGQIPWRNQTEISCSEVFDVRDWERVLAEAGFEEAVTCLVLGSH